MKILFFTELYFIIKPESWETEVNIILPGFVQILGLILSQVSLSRALQYREGSRGTQWQWSEARIIRTKKPHSDWLDSMLKHIKWDLIIFVSSFFYPVYRSMVRIFLGRFMLVMTIWQWGVKTRKQVSKWPLWLLPFWGSHCLTPARAITPYNRHRAKSKSDQVSELLWRWKHKLSACLVFYPPRAP